jgi:hypothetical protein
MEEKKPVSALTRFAFFLVLGLYSTFFAEVLSGSAPDFLTNSFGYFGIFPIYALHSVLLAALIFSRKKPFSLRTLYFVSLLFGMYEAYITKVIWEPPWGETLVKVAGISVIDTAVLVLFWHAVISFIIPLILSEELLTSSGRIRRVIPEKWRARLLGWRGVVLLGLFGSFMVGQKIADPGDALALVLLDCLAIVLMAGAWKLIFRKRDLDLADLLPRKWGRWVYGILMAGYYLFFGLTIRREVRPGFAGHAMVLLMYAGIGVLIYLSMRKDSQDEVLACRHDEPRTGAHLKFKHLLLYCGTFIAGTFFVNILPPGIEEWVFGLSFFACLVMGLIFLVRSIISLFRKNNAQEKLSAE